MGSSYSEGYLELIYHFDVRDKSSNEVLSILLKVEQFFDNQKYRRMLMIRKKSAEFRQYFAYSKACNTDPYVSLLLLHAVVW